jgi:very-short-patch-repair endonuclease
MRVIDYTGQKINNWKVIKPTNRRIRGGPILWECLCTCCGNIYNRIPSALKSYNVQTCKKCAKTTNFDYSGKKINNWEIIEPTTTRNKNGGILWKCRCNKCNNIYFRVPASLISYNKEQCIKCTTRTSVSKCADRLLDKIEQFLQYPINREYSVENKVYDGYISRLNLLIESDGSYWHSIPEQKLNDRFKDELAKKHGFILLRFKNDSELDANIAFEQFKQWHNAQQ